MTCFYPYKITPLGRRETRVACGKCIGCRIDYSRMWAARCMHEAQLHQDNCFVTLTYADRNLPPDGGLKPEDFTAFMMRLRTDIYPKRISYFMVGEYGDDKGRPHYHALIFGHDFGDKKFYRNSKAIKTKSSIFTSESLNKLWRYGDCFIGSVTYQSAAYCARYSLKKITGDRAKTHYQRIDETTGEIHDVVPEYMRCSKNPAIGLNWFKKFNTDVFPDDFLVVDGKKHPVPKYYTKLLKRADAPSEKSIKQRRFKLGIKGYKNSTPQRLAVRAEVKKAQLSQLKRDIE